MPVHRAKSVHLALRVKTVDRDPRGLRVFVDSRE